MLFAEKSGPGDKPDYQDFFIAARPQTRFATDCFEMLCEVIRTGQLSSARLKAAYYLDRSVGAKRIKYLTYNVINSVIEAQNNPEHYYLQVVESDISAFAKP